MILFYYTCDFSYHPISFLHHIPRPITTIFKPHLPKIMTQIAQYHKWTIKVRSDGHQSGGDWSCRIR